MMKLFLKLFISLFFINFLYASVTKVSLDKFFPPTNTLKGSNAIIKFTIPTANRWDIKEITMYVEYSPSKGLIKERSSISFFFNGVLIFKKRLDPDIDIYKEKIKIPVKLLEKYNTLTIKASQHYCMNCCENEMSSELWTKVFFKNSYIKYKFNLKPIKPNLLSFRDYVIDSGIPTGVEFGILTENYDDFYLTQGAKISSYLGSIIKYRKVVVDNVSDLNVNKDIFVIGTKKFIKQLFNLKKIDSNIFVLPNPNNNKYAIVVITDESKNNILNVVNSFISMKESLFIGKNIDFESIVLPKINAYDSPKFIPLDKKIYFSDLGYDDLKMFRPGYQYDIKFNIPLDLFRYNHYNFILHIYYNYNLGIRKDSVINIFLNGKFVTNLKMDNDYGTILDDQKLKIPVYLLNPGENKITIQYGFMTTGEGHCVFKNFYELGGTVFSKKSYIEIPNLPHWIKMPFLEYFTSEAFPFSIYPDLKDTQIYISDKKDKTISSLYTLASYIGTKTLVPLFGVNVVSDVNNVDKNKHIIAIGSMLPAEYFKYLPIKISQKSIVLKIPLIQKITNFVQKELLGESADLNTLVSMKNTLTQETIITLSKSPYNENKVILAFISPMSESIYKSIVNLFDPKFVSKIKNNIVIVDNNKVYSTKVGSNFYLGHLPFFDYILFKLGFSPAYLILYTLIVVIMIVIIVKILLDFREKRRMKS